MSKERPISMSDPMVLAILENRKTVTRHLVKPQPPSDCQTWAGWLMDSNNKLDDGKATWADSESPLMLKTHLVRCPYGQVGDRLWVREKWVYRAMPRCNSRLNLEITGVKVERMNSITEEESIAEGAIYHDFGRLCWHRGGWKPVGDCPAPMETHPRQNGWTMEPGIPGPEYCLGSARMAFANLINKTYGPDCWELNPWVFAISFKKIT